jgi:hypothetical protein
MKRREMMKLASLAIMLPMMPGVAQANSENEAPTLRYKVFTITRPGHGGIFEYADVFIDQTLRFLAE